MRVATTIQTTKVALATEYETETAAFREAVREGIRDADAGRVHPHSEVKKWLLSWGTDAELPPPRLTR